MTGPNRVALGGGVLAAGVGLALAVRPGLLALPVGEAGVGLLGGVAVVYGLLTAVGRRNTERRAAADPQPEEVPTVAPPGDDLDRLFAVAGTTSVRNAERRHRLRQRLEAAAIRAVCRRDDCGADTARAALAAGTWTDDPVASTYFTDDPVAVGDADLSPARRLRFRLSDRARQVYAARRVADEIAAITEPDGPPARGAGDGEGTAE